MPSVAATAQASRALKSRHRDCAHSTITGVTTSAPATSPSHQVTQIGLNLFQSAKPATLSVTTPMVALITVAGPTATSTNFATRDGLVKVSTPARPARDQIAAGERFQRIAERDEGGGYFRAGGGDIGGEGADEDRRP